jgi:hypothetical protein
LESTNVRAEGFWYSQRISPGFLNATVPVEVCFRLKDWYA